MKLHGVRFSIHRTFFSLPPLISSLSLPRVFYRLSHTCTNHLTFSHRSTKRDRIVFFRRIKQVGENSFEMVFPFSLFFFFLFDENGGGITVTWPKEWVSKWNGARTPFCQNVLSFLILSRRLSKRRQKLLYRDENHTILRTAKGGREKEREG